MTRHVGRHRITIVVVAAAAMLAGCGSTDGGGAAADVGSGAARTTSTPRPGVQIGPATPRATSTPGPEEGGDGASASTESGGNSAEPERCAASALGASFSFEPGGGTAGGTVGLIRLRNAGAAPCTLAGYPGVSFVGEDGSQIGAAARRTPADASTVTLEAGSSATAEVLVQRPGKYPEERCRGASATGLRIYPPGSRASLTIEKALPACRSSDVSLLSVKPVRSAG